MVSPPEMPDQHVPSSGDLTLQSGKGRYRRWRRYGWGLLPLAIAAGLGIVYAFNSAAQNNAAPGVTTALVVNVIEAKPVGQYTTERRYTGELVAGRSSTLGFEQAGMVVSILVKEGDRVTSGQPLARLDTRTLTAQRQQLEAQRQVAMAQLRELQSGPRQEKIAAAQATVAEVDQQLALAQLQRDRRENLYTQGAISREDLDREIYSTGALENRLAQAQSQLDELSTGTRVEQLDAQAARVSQLDASLKQLDVELEKSILLAPFDGIVSVRSVDEGVVVGGGQAVLSLVEAAPLEARVGVPPQVADTLQVGSEHRVTVGTLALSAPILALLPELDATSRTVTVVLQIPTADLTVGQTVHLNLSETQVTEGFWLPTTALVPGERGLWSAYVLTEPAAASGEPSSETYQVSRREIEVVHTEGASGDIPPENRVLVRGTLQAGERVIATGTHRIVPGEWVRVGE